jgi:hypothetical protein
LSILKRQVLRQAKIVRSGSNGTLSVGTWQRQVGQGLDHSGPLPSQYVRISAHRQVYIAVPHNRLGYFRVNTACRQQAAGSKLQWSRCA